MASSYQQRIASYLAAHPGATRSAARGHGATPEHGSFTRGNTVEVYRGADARKVIDRIAAEDEQRRAEAAKNGQPPPPYRRVVVTTFDKHGGHKSVGANPGHKRGMTAKYTSDQLKTARTFRRGLTNAEGGTKYRTSRGAALERVQITIEG